MLVLLLVAGLLVTYDLSRAEELPVTVSPTTSASADGHGQLGGPVPTVARAGAGTFAFAAEVGPVVGQDGPLLTYRVAVEDGVGVDPAAFGSAVESILSDTRGWLGEGNRRLQRVAGPTPSSFVVLLASPVTSEQLCRVDFLETDQYTNCRLGDNRVIINSERWLTAVPDYGAGLDVYRAYALNHEVGHQFGYGHELCPSPGVPAPVMQQQTYGLQGCVANGWPFVNGGRYTGPPTDT
jgi:Protein of unknown function (DUF3152)